MYINRRRDQFITLVVHLINKILSNQLNRLIAIRLALILEQSG